MCDPLVGGLIAGAASIATGAMQANQMSDLQDKQNDANNQWVAYQTKIHQEQTQAEDEARQRANSARLDTLQKVSPQAQQQDQTTEQQRLNTEYVDPGAGKSGDPSDPTARALLSGQSPNAASMTDLTSQVNQATSQARGRIAALATAGSYGGTFGGLGTTVPINFAQGGNQIQMENDIRNANLKTYGVEQQVQPLQYAAGPGAGQMGGIATALGKIAGSGLGNAWGGSSGVNFGGNVGSGFYGADQVNLGSSANPLAGLTAADYGPGF